MCYSHGKLNRLSCQGEHNEESLIGVRMTQNLPSLYSGNMYALRKSRCQRLCTGRKEAGEGAIEEKTSNCVQEQFTRYPHTWVRINGFLTEHTSWKGAFCFLAKKQTKHTNKQTNKTLLFLPNLNWWNICVLRMISSHKGNFWL